jgi:hypothetical protein
MFRHISGHFQLVFNTYERKKRIFFPQFMLKANCEPEDGKGKGKIHPRTGRGDPEGK